MIKIENRKDTIRLYMPIIILVLFLSMILFKNDTSLWIWNVLKPVVIAFVIAYLLDSIVKFFNRKLKAKRGSSILLTYLFLLGIIVLLISIIIPTIVENFNAVVSFLLDDNIDINKMVNDLKANTDSKIIKQIADFVQNSSSDFQGKLIEIITSVTTYIVKSVAGIGINFFSIITSLIISIYMLIEKEDLLARIKRLTYAYFTKLRANRIFYVSDMANNIFKRYLNGKILDAFIVGIVTVTLFTIFKVPYAPLMGSLIGAFNMIPYFGPIIGLVPVVIVSFFVDPSKALTALIIVIVVQQIDGNYLDPKIVSNNVGVSPFWVIAAVTVGGAALGPVGMIIGVPTVVLIKTLIEEDVKLRLKDKSMENLERSHLIDPKKRKSKKKKK